MTTDTNSEIAALRNQVFTLFLALIVVSGTLTTYVYIQSRHASQDLTQAEQVVESLKKNEATINNFLQELTAYSKKDPEFATVLKKYGLPPAPGAPGGQPKK